MALIELYRANTIIQAQGTNPGFEPLSLFDNSDTFVYENDMGIIHLLSFVTFCKCLFNRGSYAAAVLVEISEVSFSFSRIRVHFLNQALKAIKILNL